MKRAGSILLSAGIVILLMCFTVTSYAAFGGYSRPVEIKYTGVDQDRGVAVNKNPDSPYYGYLYVCDGTANNRCVRILAPTVSKDYTAATSYTEVAKLAYPATLGLTNNLLISCFVTPDDKVWVVDYSAKEILTGDPAGGDLTVLPIPGNFTMANPRGVYVVGNYNQEDTKLYVAEATAGGASDCEIFQYNGGNWTRIFEMGDTKVNGLVSPYTVAVDKDGNSYWASVSAGNNPVLPNFKYVLKLKPDFTVDTNFALQIPDGFLKKADGTVANSLIPTQVVYVQDNYDLDTPDYIAVSFNGSNSSAFPHNNCVLRFKTDGSYLDGFGMQGWAPNPTQVATMSGKTTPPSYNPLEFWDAPSGNKNPWMTVDDKHNFYVLTIHEPRGSDSKLFVPVLAKFSRPLDKLAAVAPTDLVAGNDIYGQVKLSWTDHTWLKGVKTGVTYNIYRSTDTTMPATPYKTVLDGYNKWKDADQGVDATGGPFYYWVTAVTKTGESAAAGPVGPIAPSAPTAPAARSKDSIAVSYSEYSDTDKIEVGNISSYWGMLSSFLTKRNVKFTKVFDADPSGLNVENDDLAGYPLFWLLCNREMSSYEAQCIADYVKYSGGRIVSCYWNTETTINRTFLTGNNFRLADVYGIDRGGWGSDSRSIAWNLRTFRYMRPTTDPAVAPLAAPLFDGIPTAGAMQPQLAPIAELAVARDDPNVKVLATWCDMNGIPPYGVPGSMNPSGNVNWNAAAIARYSNGEPVSLWFGLMWWWRMPETPDASYTSYSSTKVVENILRFFNIGFTPVGDAGASLGDRLLNYGDNNTAGLGELVITMAGANTVLANGQYCDEYYVESKDRTAGTKIRIPQSMLNGQVFSPGQIITVSGNITSDTDVIKVNNVNTTIWGDRVLEVWEFWKAGGITDIAPLYIPNKSAVGAYVGHQQGSYEATGLNNLGMYVKVTGTVTYVNTDGGYLNYFYIDDGSGLLDGTSHDDNGTPTPNVGLRVVFPRGVDSLYPTYYPGTIDAVAVGNHVSVVGCTTLALTGQVTSIGPKGAIGLRSITAPITPTGDMTGVIDRIDN